MISAINYFAYCIVKKFIVDDVWELRKIVHMIRMVVLVPSLTPRGGIGVRMEFSNGRNGKRDELSNSSDVVDTCTCTHSSVDLHVNVCGSAHCCGCMVSGDLAMVTCCYYRTIYTHGSYVSAKWEVTTVDSCMVVPPV